MAVKSNRRELLKLSSMGALGGLALSSLAAERAHAEEEPPNISYASWIHGHSMEIEYPDRIIWQVRKGYAYQLEGKPGTANWFHFAIPTPGSRSTDSSLATSMSSTYRKAAWSLLYLVCTSSSLGTEPLTVLSGLRRGFSSGVDLCAFGRYSERCIDLSANQVRFSRRQTAMKTLRLKHHLPFLLVMALIATSQAASYKESRLSLPFTMGQKGKGGLLATDMNGDGKMDLLVTSPGQLAALESNGNTLWHTQADIRVSAGSSEGHGLPGHDAPGAQICDIDGDGRVEILFLDQSNTIHVLAGDTGLYKSGITIPNPKGSERWEHMAVVNLRGKGDKDIVLQCTNSKGYRVGHYVSAYAVDNSKAHLLWSTDRFGALAHGPFRAADLDADGRDEICGYTILGPDGKGTDWAYPPINKAYADGASFHIDSIFIYDVRPDIPGLEVVLLEEGRNYTALANAKEGLLWWTTNQRQEPQNAAVGEFSLEHEGLEIWCRSRYNTHQKPWVLDSHGKIIASYQMVDFAPEGWTTRGVEVIVPIDWSGTRLQLAAAKERHESGDIGLFRPTTGEFILHIKAKADRLYVADITGDWREEIIIVEGKQIRFFENTAPNAQPLHARLWTQQNYRRSKMSWNYYSP